MNREGAVSLPTELFCKMLSSDMLNIVPPEAVPSPDHAFLSSPVIGMVPILPTPPEDSFYNNRDKKSLLELLLASPV